MSKEREEVASLLDGVQNASRALRRLGDMLHEDMGITAAMRAVMEYIRENGPSTVPDIARAKAVSRQNIQVLVDALTEHGLVDLRKNPAHKRSSLVTLTRAGSSAFTGMQRRERKVLDQLAKELSPNAVRSARRMLDKLNESLEARGQG